MQEEIVALFIPIVLLIVVGVIAFTAIYFGFRSRKELQTTVRTAIEQGQELSTDVLATIAHEQKKRHKDADLRRGAVLIATGVGVAAFAWILWEEDATRARLGLSMIPLAVGIAMTLLWLIRRHKG